MLVPMLVVALSAPVDLVVVLGTMEPRERYRAVEKADVLLKALETNGGARVEVVDGPTVVQGPTLDIATARTALMARDRYAAERPTTGDALWQRIERAMSRLASVKDGHRVLVFIGQDADLLSSPALLQRARESRVSIYPVLVSRLDAAEPVTGASPTAGFVSTTSSATPPVLENAVPYVEFADSGRGRTTAEAFDRVKAVAEQTGGIAVLDDVGRIASAIAR